MKGLTAVTLCKSSTEATQASTSSSYVAILFLGHGLEHHAVHRLRSFFIFLLNNDNKTSEMPKVVIVGGHGNVGVRGFAGVDTNLTSKWQRYPCVLHAFSLQNPITKSYL